MGMRFMEHILILTGDPDGTRDWWVDALGFTEGDHPDFGFPVHWLCIGDQDVIHIGQRNQSEHQSTYLATPTDSADRTDPPVHAGGGTIDHVCFNCSGIEEFADRLEKNGIKYNERQAHDQSLYQLFFMEPINGIKVELNFSAEEAAKAGRSAARTAADAAD